MKDPMKMWKVTSELGEWKSPENGRPRTAVASGADVADFLRYQYPPEPRAYPDRVTVRRMTDAEQAAYDKGRQPLNRSYLKGSTR